MNHPALLRTAAVLWAISTLCAGCNRQIAAGRPVAKPIPEERFQRILDTFRRNIEGQPVGFVVSNGGSRSTLVGTNKVSSKLIPPASADDHYKAVITVTSESHYSLRGTKNSAEEAERDQNAANQSSKTLSDPKEKKGVGILEPDLAGKPRNDPSEAAPKATQSDEEKVSRRRNESVRKYELVYDGERWELITKLDPKTERSIKFAFEEAFDRQ
jgi:hypothetical protein